MHELGFEDQSDGGPGDRRRKNVGRQAGVTAEVTLRCRVD